MSQEINQKLLFALENLFALVQGEAPSLLEDDHHFDMVTEAINEAKVAPPPLTEGDRWVDFPDEQGWWWHFYDGAAVPFPYCVLRFGTGNRYFIQYPDSRWCDEVGGKWMKIKVPAPPKLTASPDLERE